MPKVILLVEDNQTDIELMRRAFAKVSVACELIVKEDGQEAMDFLSDSNNSIEAKNCLLPDLILLDLKMPKISGIEVLRHIRQSSSTRRIPVVILTSSAEESDLAAAYDLGANSYLRKPVDFKKFVEAVNALCHYWFELNEPPPR